MKGLTIIWLVCIAIWGMIFFEYRKSVKKVKYTECILKELVKIEKEK